MTAWGPHVLITSAGRRVGLIEAFREAGYKLGVPVTVHACDMNPMLSAGCAAADHAFAVPPCSDPSYVEVLLAYCAKAGITLLIPTIDTELSVLAAGSGRFREIGCRVHVGSTELINIVRDKALTCAHLAAHGVPVPRTYTPDAARHLSDPNLWPLFSKPSGGSASRGLLRIARPEDMPDRFDEPTILQEFLVGPEYTVNIFVDQLGSLRATVPHLRLSVRAGEVEKGRTVRDARFEKIARDLVASLPKPRGVMCFQMIDDAKRGLRVFEINARFGGGFPLANRAGGAFAHWLLAESLGRDSGAHNNWIDGVEMLRYDAAYFRQPSNGGMIGEAAE